MAKQKMTEIEKFGKWLPEAENGRYTPIWFLNLCTKIYELKNKGFNHAQITNILKERVTVEQVKRITEVK